MAKITIYGATGVVGILCAEYLAGLGQDSVCLAGRNRAALEDIRDRLNASWEVAVADAHDSAALEELARGTSVVIAVVGPYLQLGKAMVDACAAAGTDYIDLCGEVPFIRASIDRNHALAQRTGARIVHSCGFDSVPSDMGMFNLAQAAGEPFTEVQMVVDKLVGGISPGTIESARQVSLAAHADKAVARNIHNPYSLNPDPSSGARLEGLNKDFEFKHLDGVGWVGPFFMSMFNTRIVRRSNALLNNAWGDRLYYKESWFAGKGLLGRMKSYGLGVATKILFDGTQNPRTRPFVEKVLPKPGIENGYFKVSHYGTTVSGKRWHGTVSATGDPGYETTARMLGQAAITLLENPSDNGGVLTPATALGSAFQTNLEKAGLRFSAIRED